MDVGVTRTAAGFRTLAVLVLASSSAFVVASLWLNDGHLVYPLDDPYIHLTVARELASSGTWGLTPGDFQSASSSPLWTVVLAFLVLLTPDRVLVVLPLVLTTASALWASWSMSRLIPFERITAGPRRTAAVVGAFLFSGMAPAVVIGMEHALHMALVLAALVPFLRMLDGTASARDRLQVAALLALATLCRFETLALIAGLGAALIVQRTDDEGVIASLRRRRRDLGILAASGAVPFLAFAAINMSAGQGPLPSSVIAKSDLDQGLGHQLLDVVNGTRLLTFALLSPGLLAVGVVAAILAAIAWRTDRLRAGLLLALVVAVVLEGCLGGGSSWSLYAFRYQIYLLAVATVVIARVLMVSGGAIRIRPMVSRSVTYPLVVASVLAVLPVATMIPSSNEIYRQQTQTGLFLGDFADGESIAVNDLGQVALRHRGPLLDFVGLGSYDVLKAREDGEITVAKLEALTEAHSVVVVAIFPDWFDSGVPSSWVPVRRWCLTGPILIAGGRCVQFYGTSPAEAATLSADLDAFEPRLPDGVDVRAPDAG